jgi:dTDP-glucose 4,6-dehydratase
MKVLVTGGAGFIGSAFVRLILSDSSVSPEIDSVIVLDSLTYSGNLDNLREVQNDKRLTIEIGSITNQSLVQKCMQGIDIVFHFAAESHVDRSIMDGTLFIETNVLGSYIIFDAALKAKVSKVIHVSTDEVYGSVVEGESLEDSHLEPNSPYAASKASSDLLARSFYKTHGLPVLVTRCSNNYGPFQHIEKLIPLAITNILQGRKVPIYGDGRNQREWIHVDDHARAILMVSNYGNPGEIYNIGGKNRISNLALINLIQDKIPVEFSETEFVEDRKGHDFRYALNSEKLSSLGYREAVDFSSGLSEVIKWYIDNEEWWKKLLSN